MLRLLLFWVLLAQAITALAVPSAADFAKLPSFSDPVISPDGKDFISTMTYEGEALVVVQPLKLSADDKRKYLYPMSVGDFYISGYRWANNNRIILWVRDTDKVGSQVVTYTRMLSINKDGTDTVVFRMKPNDWGWFLQYPQVTHWLPDDEDHIIAELDPHPTEWGQPNLHKVNVNTGKRKLLQRSSRGINEWVVDYDGNVRIGVNLPTGKKLNVTTYYRDNNDAKWEKLQKLDYFDHDRLIPYRFDKEDSNILLVSSDNLSAETTDDSYSDLFRYDLTKREIIGPYENSRTKSVRKAAENALPDHEVAIQSIDRAKNRYIFELTKDTEPTKYYVLDVAEKQFVYLGSQYPKLEDQNHASMQTVSYEARDGFEVPAFVTLPVDYDGKKQVPLIVYPHGGPWAHDEWGFDNYVQYFASKGYAVLQPQFRGSTGYGIEHEEAGYKQWGAAIQDDITDGVAYTLENYAIDKDKVCIVGASFGGYAVGMGLASTPDLYRCGISMNGVLDLPKYIRDGSSLLYESINKAIWNDKKDAKLYSPYHLADNITAPMLIITNKHDSVVPCMHSKSMYKRLKGKKKDVEYVEIKEGEHWRSNEASEIQSFQAMDAFLNKHLN